MNPGLDRLIPTGNAKEGALEIRKLSENCLDSPQHPSINESFSGLTLNSSFSTSETPVNNSATFYAESNISIPKPIRHHKRSHNNNLLNTSMSVINERDNRGIPNVSSYASLVGIKQTPSVNNSFSGGKGLYVTGEASTDNLQKMKNENGLMDSITSINSSLMKSNNSINNSQFLNQLGNNSNVQMNNSSVQMNNNNSAAPTNAANAGIISNANCGASNTNFNGTNASTNAESQFNVDMNLSSGINDCMGILPNNSSSHNIGNQAWMSNNSGASSLGIPCSIYVPYSGLRNSSRTSMMTEGAGSQIAVGEPMVPEELQGEQESLQYQQLRHQQQQYQAFQQLQLDQTLQQMRFPPQPDLKQEKPFAQGVRAGGSQKILANALFNSSTANGNRPGENLFFYPWGFPQMDFIENMKKTLEESQRNQSRAKVAKFIGKLTEEERRKRIEKYWEKKKNRKGKLIRYDIRKNLADQRKRVQGKFVKTKLKNDILYPLSLPGTKEETSSTLSKLAVAFD